MNLTSMGIAGVAAITVICSLAGQVVKALGLDKKWIPVVCGLLGCILGVVGLLAMPTFPATDYVTAAAVGVASGLAATGAHQVCKQLSSQK